MKYLKVLSIVLLCISGCKASIKTVINDDIDKSLQKEIEVMNIAIFDAIRDKNLDEFNGFLSPQLANTDMKKSFDYLNFMLSRYELEIIDEYYTRIKPSKKDNTTVLSIIPPGKEDKLSINNLKLIGNESYNIFYKCTNSAIEYLLFIGFSRHDNEWKISTLHSGDYSVNNLTIPDLYIKVQDLIEKKDFVNSYVYANAMKKLVEQSNFVTYNNTEDHHRLYAKAYSELIRNIHIPSTISNIAIYDISTEFMEDDGIVPLVRYITDTDIDDPDIESEILNLKYEIIKKFPKIDKEFSYIIMRAYNSTPDIPKRNYVVYNTKLVLSE